MELILISELASKIIHTKPPDGMTTLVVAIDGPGGAGKSTLAMKLSAHLQNCPIIHTDDFATWDIPLLWYPCLIAQVFEPLRENRAARYRKYDWNLQALGEWIEIPESRFVILEGVSSARKEFRPYLSFSIFVKTESVLRMKRGLERDGEGAREQWVAWRKAEDAHFATDETEAFVDVIIPGH